MKEEFLHFLWNHKLIDSTSLRTVDHQQVIIHNYGIFNKHSGPDFLHASIEIGNINWVGHVEFHINSSDWYHHHHHLDKNYDVVILHIVLHHDEEVYVNNSVKIPTVEIEIDPFVKYKENYEFLKRSKKWIACEGIIASVDSFVVSGWLERLFLERLENKCILLENYFNQVGQDWEALLFWLLAKSFGLKINQEPFLELAKSIPINVLRKTRIQPNSLEALFFGQANFLNSDIQDSYFIELQNEYGYLKHKFKLEPQLVSPFQFFRMRPSNFPTIRIAQLASLYAKYKSVFDKVIATENIEQVYELFSVEVSEFWKSHYSFTSPSKQTNKKLTKSFINLLLINTIVPLKFFYHKKRGEYKTDVLLNFMNEIKPEKNAVIQKFEDLKISVQSSMKSQALLELKNNYCDKKKCMQCAIGVNVIKS